MANFGKQFQEEVRRLARKETKDDIQRLQREQVELRRMVSLLKKRLSALEQKTARLGRSAADKAPRNAPAEELPAEGADRARISSRTVRTLRQKLGLTQAEFARLVGVSGQSVYQWERQDGRLQLRHATRKAIVEAKKLGVREARARLEESKG